MRSTYHVSWVVSRVMETTATLTGKYYDAYPAFLTSYLQSHSLTEALENFVFSPAYNFRSDLASDGRDSKEEKPQMLDRLLAGLVQPFIHLAYGLGFGITQGTWSALPPNVLIPNNLTYTHICTPPALPFPAWHRLQSTGPTKASSFLRLTLQSQKRTTPRPIPPISRLASETSGFGASASASAPEKHPTFAFQCRICDDSAFTVDPPSEPPSPVRDSCKDRQRHDQQSRSDMDGRVARK